MYGPPGELMNAGTPGPTLGVPGPELDWYLTPGPLSISMCGLNALRLGWLSTCWRVGVGVGVVVVVVWTDIEGAVAVVVVAAPDGVMATEPSNAARVEPASAAAANNPSVDRLRIRTARRERPDRNDVKFMPAPRCLNAENVHRDCNCAPARDGWMWCRG